MKTATCLSFLITLVSVNAVAGQSLDAPTFTAFGFGDVVYLATEREVADGFLLGQVVGHLNVGLTDRLNVFSEVSASARPNGFTIEAERLILRYDFTDALKLSLGRYHTPVSYWNTAFHHGAWLQTSVARPEMIKFGSRLLPVHFVGVLAEGNVPVSPLGLSYGVGVGNGRGANIARAGDAGDVNDQRAWLASVGARPPALFGLQFGASIYSDRASPENGPETDERILSAHALWSGEAPEVIAEYARILHDPVVDVGDPASSDAYYVQVGYRLPGSARAFKPYVRAEQILIPEADLLLAPLGLEYEGVVAGVRYDFAPLAALKAEYRREQFGSLERFNSLYLQASFAVTGAAGAAHH